MSCTDIIVTGEDYSINVYGSYALSNSVINGENNMNIELGGYYGGYGAVLNCDDGARCRIVCYGNGCFGFQLNCVAGSDCIVSCDDTQGRPCPITYGVDRLPDIPTNELDIQLQLDDIASQSGTYNEHNCNLAGALSLDNRRQYIEDGSSTFPSSTLESEGRGNVCSWIIFMSWSRYIIN